MYIHSYIFTHTYIHIPFMLNLYDHPTKGAFPIKYIINICKPIELYIFNQIYFVPLMCFVEGLLL